MSNTILPKRKSTAGSVPTAANLQPGELAVNTADGRLYTELSNGTVVNLPVQSIAGQDISPNQVTADTVLAPSITNATQMNPLGMARFATTRVGGQTFGMTLRSSSGYVTVRWWDGSVVTYGAGSSSADIFASLAVPSTGNWRTHAPKEVFVWASTSAGFASGNLTRITCSSSQLYQANVAGLASLTHLNLSFNSLRSIDLRGCTALQDVRVSGNPIGRLDVSSLTSLTVLDATNCGLTRLDVRSNTALTSLSASSNSLTSIDVSQNTALVTLALNSNNLTSINVSQNTSLTTLVVNSNNLSSLSVSGLTSLQNLVCYSNASISSLNLSSCAALASLSCGYCNISSLTLPTSASSLLSLYCEYNPLGSLNLSAYSNLQNISCKECSLSTLTLPTTRTSLLYLDCSYNSLTTLILSGATNLQTAALRGNSLTSLRAVGVGLYLGGGYYTTYSYYSGLDAGENSLSGTALNVFYNDLANNTDQEGGVLDVRDNPGVGSDAPTIATDKGYIVLR